MRSNRHTHVLKNAPGVPPTLNPGASPPTRPPFTTANHKQVTGLGVNELAYATGVVGTKLWWNKEDPLIFGYGAVLMPEEKCKWYLEVLGQVRAL